MPKDNENNNDDLAYFIRAVHLGFDFTRNRAEVIATMRYELDPQHATLGAPLILRGLALTTIKKIRLQSVAINHEQYKLENNDTCLTIACNDSSGTIEITTFVDYNFNILKNGLYFEDGTIIVQCHDRGIENITYFLRREDNLVEISTSICIKSNYYDYFLCSGQQLEPVVITNGSRKITWQDTKAKHIDKYILVVGNLTKAEIIRPSKFSNKKYVIQLFYVDKFSKDIQHVLDILAQLIAWQEQRNQSELKFSTYILTSLPLRDSTKHLDYSLNVIADKCILKDSGPICDSDFFQYLKNIAYQYFANQNCQSPNHEATTEVLTGEFINHLAGYPKYEIDKLRQSSDPIIMFQAELTGKNNTAIDLWFNIYMQFHKLVLSWHMLRLNNSKAVFLEIPENLICSLRSIMLDPNIPHGLKADILEIPTNQNLYTIIIALKNQFVGIYFGFIDNYLGMFLQPEWLAIYLQLQAKYNNEFSLAASDTRQLRTLCVHHLANTHNHGYIKLFQLQANSALHRQDRYSALNALTQYKPFIIEEDEDYEDNKYSSSDSGSDDSLEDESPPRLANRSPVLFRSSHNHLQHQSRDKLIEDAIAQVIDWGAMKPNPS